MAEKAVATEEAGAIGQLSPAQTDKLAEFGRGLQQSALEALGTTLDKTLEVVGGSQSTVSPDDLAADYSGMFVVIDTDVRLEDGTSLPALLIFAEDDASGLFN